MKNKKLIIIAIPILVILLGFAVLSSMSSPVDKSNDDIIVVKIENGSSTGTIAAVLEEAGTVKNTTVFKIKSKLGGFDGTYKAGSYGVSKAMSMKEQMELIQSGKTVGKLFTVLEGSNVTKDAKIIAKAGIATEKEFLKEAEKGKFDYEFLKDAPDNITRLEGFLYPDTYQVSPDGGAHEAIDMMLRNFNNNFTEEYYAQAKKMNRSVREIITVASIVEREAKTAEDKKNVASVIYNRLEIGMPLQMDSILAYITGEEKIKASLADTQVESEYNPYTNQGLPPGPICSPGKEAIEAALYPADTKYIYFVAAPELDGTNVFSETYDEFLKDKAAFDKAYKEYIKKNPGKV